MPQWRALMAKPKGPRHRLYAPIASRNDRFRSNYRAPYAVKWLRECSRLVSAAAMSVVLVAIASGSRSFFQEYITVTVVMQTWTLNFAPQVAVVNAQTAP